MGDNSAESSDARLWVQQRRAASPAVRTWTAAC